MPAWLHTENFPKLTSLVFPSLFYSLKDLKTVVLFCSQFSDSPIFFLFGQGKEEAEGGIMKNEADCHLFLS